MWAVYLIAGGRLHSIGDTVADPLPEGMAKKFFPGHHPNQGKVWNEGTLEFDLGPDRGSNLSVEEFLDLFTRQERIAIRNSADDNVADYWELLRYRERVHLKAGGVVQALNYLEAQGLIGPGRASEISNG